MHSENCDEEWRPAPGYPKYEVSNYSRIRNIATGLILKQGNNKGYPKIRLMMEDLRRGSVYPHRLCAMVFVPNPYNLQEVNHIDFNKANGYYKNLEWTTRKRNMTHYFCSDRVAPAKRGEANKSSKFSDEQVKEMFRLRESGLSLREIGERTGAHLAHVSDILNGIARNYLGLDIPKVDKRRKMPDSDVVLISKLRSEGKTYKEIAEITGWHKATIGDMFRLGRKSVLDPNLLRVDIDCRRSRYKRRNPNEKLDTVDPSSDVNKNHRSTD